MVSNRAMGGFVGLMLATVAAAKTENVVLITPDPSAQGTDLAVVWIQGADYEAAQYTEIATEF